MRPDVNVRSRPRWESICSDSDSATNEMGESKGKVRSLTSSSGSQSRVRHRGCRDAAEGPFRFGKGWEGETLLCIATAQSPITLTLPSLHSQARFDTDATQRPISEESRMWDRHSALEVSIPSVKATASQVRYKNQNNEPTLQITHKKAVRISAVPYSQSICMQMTNGSKLPNLGRFRTLGYFFRCCRHCAFDESD